MAFPSYEVLSATVSGKPVSATEYRHNAPFIDGDTRTIAYAGQLPVSQTFHGCTATGGWYDNE